MPWCAQRACGARSTQTTQPARGRAASSAAGRGKPRRLAKARARVNGYTRQSVRHPDRPVVELDCGVVVYPSRGEGDVWRAVWVEDGRRRYRAAVTEAGPAVKLEKVIERLSAAAVNMERPGADLIALNLSPDRLPAGRQWSRKHAHTQRRLCERFTAPVIGGLACRDITTSHMQQIVNAAPTPGEGDRFQGMISALVGAGIAEGYLVNPRLKGVHWQAGTATCPHHRKAWRGNRLCSSTPARSPLQALKTCLRADAPGRIARVRRAPLLMRQC